MRIILSMSCTIAWLLTHSHTHTHTHTGPGEEVLQQFQVSREESQKLKEIEEQLSAIWEEKAREAEALVRDMNTTGRQCLSLTICTIL